ncbi:MAG: DUF6602 domain-containing protein [Myxococcota bacterium]
MKKVDLGKLFFGLQDELASKLGTTRSVVGHGGAKGAATEAHWQEMLSAFLPTRYQVSKGFVVDADGARSDELDLIIHDRQYSPFLLPYEGAHHVPAESVYAVFEVKQDISKARLEYAGDKAASVRALRRTSVSIRHAGGTFPPKPPGPILAGFLCLESSWAGGLGDAFDEHLAALSGDRVVDLGCVLNHGAFHRDEGDTLSTSSADTALVWFFVTLVSRLQRLGTVPALDLHQYLEVIEGAADGDAPD